MLLGQEVAWPQAVASEVELGMFQVYTPSPPPPLLRGRKKTGIKSWLVTTLAVPAPVCRWRCRPSQVQLGLLAGPGVGR